MYFYFIVFISLGWISDSTKKEKTKKKEKNDIQDGCKYNEHDFKKRGVRYIRYILGCIVI